jgi:protein O-GlcNAc transferase
MKQPDFTPSVRQLMKRAESAMKKEDGGSALQLLGQVLATNPYHVEALYNIGYIYQCVGKYLEAQQYYERAIQADPSYIDTYLMLTKLLEESNQGDQAVQIANLATQLAPENPRTHLELCGLLVRFNQAHVAVDYIEKLLPKFANDVPLMQVYCMTLKMNERHEEANVVYDRLVKELKAPLAARVLYETYLPRLHRTAEEIDHVRERFKQSLQMFIERKVKIDINSMKFQPIFQLAFHNRDNKELTQLFVKTLRSMDPILTYTAPHCKAAPVKREGKIRVGFISRCMHNHSVGSCYRGVMIALAQNPDFDVTFFNLNLVQDSGIQEIIDANVRMVSLPNTVNGCRDIIVPYQLDIIVYPDIGMDAMSHYLAMSRMAPYQLCFQGHPETTGIDTIDYVVSSRTYEPLHADDNYTERLLCNAGIDTVFKRPKMPSQWLTRAGFNLPEDKKLYVCPMSIQKFHPDFDDVLADILAADPKALIILFKDFQQVSASTLLRDRILKKCAPERVLFIDWLPQEFLFCIMQLADAVLDTIYFGGGTTIQYAFHFGIPVVTMPGHYARGRVTYSYYSLMGVPNAPIAKDTKEYVEVAVKLANDTAYHQKISEEILARNDAMFKAEPYAPKVVQLMHDIMDQNLDAYKR